MKTCRVCGQRKPLADFYKHKRTRDGRGGTCKLCKRRYQVDYRATHESTRDYDRQRSRTDPQRWRRLRVAYDPPLARAARYAVRQAIRHGHLTRPDRCASCGAQGVRIEGAHADYRRPLQVLWLCHRCHSRWDQAASKTRPLGKLQQLRMAI